MHAPAQGRAGEVPERAERQLGVERELLRQSLELARGNKARAASLLNIKRTTFVEKLKRANLAGGGP